MGTDVIQIGCTDITMDAMREIARRAGILEREDEQNEPQPESACEIPQE